MPRLFAIIAIILSDASHPHWPPVSGPVVGTAAVHAAREASAWLPWRSPGGPEAAGGRKGGAGKAPYNGHES